MTDPWPESASGFLVADLNRFLLWAVGKGASDIVFQTGAPVWIEIDGGLQRASRAVLDSVTLSALCEHLYNATGEGLLRAGRALDCAYSVNVKRGIWQRFRCNLSPVQVSHAFAVNITLRVLPGQPPSFSDLGIEPGIREAWDRCRGLTLVTGIPGSGKSTLLAAGTRRLLEQGAGRIQSYEAPIEFVYDHVPAAAALMSSAEIPRDFPSFADGLRSSLRRRPAAVIVGEARDFETVDMVVRAADTGIAVYSTTHTIGVAATLRRLLAEFPASEREARGLALVDVANLFVTQLLLASPEGGRTAIREWLCFDEPLKNALMEQPVSRWAGVISKALAARGTGLGTALDHALREGRIHPRDGRRFAATVRVPEHHDRG